MAAMRMIWRFRVDFVTGLGSPVANNLVPALSLK